MKHLITFIFAMLVGVSLALSATALVITDTDGCNAWGSHANTDLISVVTNEALSYGIIVTVIPKQDLPTTLQVSDYDLYLCVNGSGDVWDLPHEIQFIQDLHAAGKTMITVHAGGPDCNRHSSVNNCNTFTDFWAETIVGCSLNQGSKHENQSGSEQISKDPIALVTQDSVYLTGLQDSVQIFDEFYYTKWSGSYWNPSNVVLWWVDVSKNGQGPMPSVWRQGQHVHIALGHANGTATPDMANPTKFQYEIFTRVLQVEMSKVCSVVFYPTWEPLLQEPIGEDKYAYTFVNNILSYGGNIGVYTMSGQEVITASNAKVDLSDLPCSVYFVKLWYNDGSGTHQFKIRIQ